jgi:hypothetical protein
MSNRHNDAVAEGFKAGLEEFWTKTEDALRQIAQSTADDDAVVEWWEWAEVGTQRLILRNGPHPPSGQTAMRHRTTVGQLRRAFEEENHE